MIYNSPTVRLVSHCFTTRTSRTGRTGRALQYTVSKSPNDIQFTNCTTREPLFHDPYESYGSYGSYGSWTPVYSLSLPNDIQFTNCTTREPLFHTPYESYGSYGSCEENHDPTSVVSVRVYWTTLHNLKGEREGRCVVWGNDFLFYIYSYL